MNEPKLGYRALVTKAAGEPVNPNVHKIAPQREPDYGAMQRFIVESADFVVGSSTAPARPQGFRRACAAGRSPGARG